MKHDKPTIKEINEIMTDFQVLGLVSLFTIGFGVVFYHMVEKLTWVDAIYFSVITLTTVGYGDITPQTDIGKLFTAGYVLMGIGIIGGFASVVLKRMNLGRRIKNAEKTDAT